MNLRQLGEPTHFYETGQSTFWGGLPLENKLKRWKKLLTYCKNPERIKVLSGPLKEII